MDTFEIRNGKAVYNGIKYDFDKLPENVTFNGNIDISHKYLTGLPNMSSWIIKGEFDCVINDLTSLKGCPKEVVGNFSCFRNRLIFIKHCPEKVGGDFNCSYNKLKSLEHCPEEIGGDFDCYNNKIKTINAWPKYIGGDFTLGRNPINFIKNGVVPLEWIIECYLEMGSKTNARKLLMKEFGCNTKKELDTYLLMMGKI